MTKSDDSVLLIYTDIDPVSDKVMESNHTTYLGYPVRDVIGALLKQEWTAEEQGKIDSIDKYFRIKESV